MTPRINCVFHNGGIGRCHFDALSDVNLEASLQDIHKRQSYGYGRRAENQSGHAEKNNAADRADQSDYCMELQPASHQNGVKEIIDRSDDDPAPDGEKDSLSPVAFKSEEDRGRNLNNGRTQYRHDG